MRKNYTESRIALPSARIKARALLKRVDIEEFDVNTDPTTGQAVLWFRTKKGKEIEIRCTSQKNGSGNLAAIMLWLHSRIINLERGIETFDNAFAGYLRLTGSTEQVYGRGPQQPTNLTQAELQAMRTLGIEAIDSWIVMGEKFKSLAKTFHPDRAMDEVHRVELEKKMSEINTAWDILCKGDFDRMEKQ